jgi:5'-3' exonuclease
LETIEGEVKISCSNYLLLMLDLLEYYHIEPFFVFDGRSLPLKAETITKRKNIREDNKNKSSAMVEK